MTLYLARKVVDGVVDESSTTYLGRCDLGDDCRYFVDHHSTEVVEDALSGHAWRAHATTTERSEDTTRTGWIPNWSYGDVQLGERSWPVPGDLSRPQDAPEWAPSPTPREDQ